MKKEKFLIELALILGAPAGSLQMDAVLADYRSWDSMAKMAALTLIDTDLGVPVPYDLLEKCRTVGELLAFVEPHFTK